MAGTPYIDDPTIRNGETLWRRIFPGWIVPDDNEVGWRVSSAAFDDSPDGSPMSVLLADVVEATNRTADDVLTGFEGYGLTVLVAGFVRSLKQGIARTPEPHEPAHASVFGSKTPKVKRALARASTWVHLPR